MKKHLLDFKKTIILSLILMVSVSFVRAQLMVNSPNGGEVLIVGTTHNITWTNAGPGGGTGTFISIKYSTDSGATWITINASAPDTGSYPWLVPNTPSVKCLVLIQKGLATLDVSNAVFTISNSSVGYTENNKLPYSIFPNPASNILYVKHTFPGNLIDTRVQLFNITGSKILEKELISEQGMNISSVDLNGVSAGLYFLRLTNGSETFEQKVIIY